MYILARLGLARVVGATEAEGGDGMRESKTTAGFPSLSTVSCPVICVQAGQSINEDVRMCEIFVSSHAKAISCWLLTVTLAPV